MRRFIQKLFDHIKLIVFVIWLFAACLASVYFSDVMTKFVEDEQIDQEERVTGLVLSQFEQSSFEYWPTLLKSSGEHATKSWLELLPREDSLGAIDVVSTLSGDWAFSPGILETKNVEHNIWLTFIDIDLVFQGPYVGIEESGQYLLRMNKELEQLPLLRWPSYIKKKQNEHNFILVLSPEQFYKIHAEFNLSDENSSEAGIAPAVIGMPIDDWVTVVIVPQLSDLSTKIRFVSFFVAPMLVGSIFILLIVPSIFRMKRASQKLSKQLGSNYFKDIDKLIIEAAERLEKTQLSQETRNNDWRDLLHAVAHEIRSPLSRISFALELLPKSGQDEELYQDIENSMEELNEMVRELLSYSRIDLQEDKSFCPTNVDDVVSDVCSRVRITYPLAEIKITGSPITIPFISRQLDRVVINLVRNAARFCEKRIQVSWKMEGDKWLLVVEDDGPGIPPGKRERVLEPFTRLDSSRSRDSGGTGLGLAIVNSICRAHNAVISIEDSYLGGAKFVLSFPLEDACLSE